MNRGFVPGTLAILQHHDFPSFFHKTITMIMQVKFVRLQIVIGQLGPLDVIEGNRDIGKCFIQPSQHVAKRNTPQLRMPIATADVSMDAREPDLAYVSCLVT